ncbi:hypothetical protein Y11_35541 [Yersinia enterocolitica subsp. palearctica Y11]|uniref:Uncharacterized protein n=1 Tax=Yersinia enterocolitica subsp. palearctica serotype O:3 (strain DSM 13030 / CIP 106945 / Y11) TaxID=930944 RepID=A0A0H3NVG1_YERE1|nr:hypothetical protein Y11_35541 [Yersinia enterocolitica subsp. palearctica Y11]CCO70910.1 hypothetical protein D322_4075 [Yersinia enterocolitica IP 10393]
MQMIITITINIFIALYNLSLISFGRKALFGSKKIIKILLIK